MYKKYAVSLERKGLLTNSGMSIYYLEGQISKVPMELSGLWNSFAI